MLPFPPLGWFVFACSFISLFSWLHHSSNILNSMYVLSSRHLSSFLSISDSQALVALNPFPNSWSWQLEYVSRPSDIWRQSRARKYGYIDHLRLAGKRSQQQQMAFSCSSRHLILQGKWSGDDVNVCAHHYLSTVVGILSIRTKLQGWK